MFFSQGDFRIARSVELTRNRAVAILTYCQTRPYSVEFSLNPAFNLNLLNPY